MTSVYNTVGMRHRVAWVCQRQRRLVFTNSEASLANILRSWRRHLLRQRTDLLEVSVLFDLLPFQRFLLLGQDVLLAHADLKTLLEATAFAEATV